MSNLSAFDPFNPDIPVARSMIQRYVHVLAQDGRLHELLQEAAPTLKDVLQAPATAFLLKGSVTHPMVERWVMEAICNEVLS